MARLFDPIQIRGLTVRNRIVMPPMANDMSDQSGAVTENHLEHYSIRAKHDVGLIMVEHCYVVREGRLTDQQLGICSDGMIPGLQRLADAITAHGAAAGVQITHAGAKASREVIGVQPVGPSDVAPPGIEDTPRPLSIKEIRTLVKSFGEAASRAARAGFDLVEIHGAHGFLLSQFLSPYTNRRTDAYGGSLTNRMRFPLEVIEAVRSGLGNLPLFYRLGADDMMPGGLTGEEGIRAAQELERAGVDVVHVSGGLCGSRHPYKAEHEGYFVPLAESVKRAVSVPVIVVGGIRDPMFADSLVADGKADMVAVGRALLEDPEWASKARTVLTS